MDIEPIEVCAPMRFENAAEVRPNSSSARQYPKSPAPTPPYSSGNGSPKNPSSPISVRTASGILSSRSTCSSIGCRRPSTNSRTVRLRRRSSSGMSASTARSLAPGDVDGGDAERQPLEADVGEARVEQHLSEPFRSREGAERPREVAVRLAVATEQCGDGRRDPIEIEGVEAGGGPGAPVRQLHGDRAGPPPAHAPLRRAR